VHSDGSIYFVGSAAAGFPTSATAYQRQDAGKSDGIIGRLDPQGSSLMFATYIGGSEDDHVSALAVSPDGSVWAAVSSITQWFSQQRLVRLDARGERVLVDKPINASDLAVDREGNAIALALGNFAASSEAFLANACGQSLAYIKLRPNGEQSFTTYVPAGTRYDFEGTTERGLPILRVHDERFEVTESQSMATFTGCVVDAASFANADTLSPGAIVTLFGSRMGPREGVAFQLENGRVPTTVGGTRVLINGEPVPILFASYWQVNAVIPYSLPVGSRPAIQVVANGNPGNQLTSAYVQPAGISLFLANDSPSRSAAALNEDGTVNSPRNPARKGSRVVLFGTGGGPTVPASVAGEVTPLEIRALEQRPQVQITREIPVTVEYAGAAPGLAAGVTQINIKLPDLIPEVPGFPRGTVPLSVITPGASFYAGYVTVAVAVD
jgi:uncharacterized protein (TIGR03437 family)